MNRDELREALQNPNVRAFLRVIREGESSQTNDAYRMVNGGRVLPDTPIEHPYKGQKAPPGKAFGAYQFLPSTWAGLVRLYGFENMSPECQDEGAVGLIYGRGALDEVQEGKFTDACFLLNREWTSLPGGSETNKKTAAARDTYTKYGGQFSDAVPEFNPDTLDTEYYGPQESQMSPFILPALEIASKFLPILAEKFGSGSEVSNRNLAAGKVLADAITEATKSPNIQAAVDEMRRNPDAVRAADEAVKEIYPELFEVGGGIAAARRASLETEGDWKKTFVTIPFAVIVMLMPIIYFVIYHVITGEKWTQEIKASVVSAVISGVLFAIVGFALGTSYGSQRKTNILAGKE